MQAHVFSQVPKIEIPRSAFDRSHEYKTTLDSAGTLYPILVDEVLPGDSFRIKAKHFLRVATLIAPIMDNLYLDTFYFFVPERLVWDNFQRMCGEQDDPGDSTDFTFPVFYNGTGDSAKPLLPSQNVGSLADYFGIPTGVNNLAYVRAEPFRCYNLIWKEWFRDENLQDSPVIEKGDSDLISNYTLLKRGKRKDYFTAALPWPMKDGTGVDLPIGGTAPIVSSGDGGSFSANSWSAAFPSLRFKVDDNTYYQASLGANFLVDPSVSGDLVPYDLVGLQNNVDRPSSAWAQNKWHNALYLTSSDGSATGPKVTFGGVKNISNLAADLSQATSVTVNEFRQAFQVQRWLERAARGGTRYTEIIRNFFGCVSPDARLQRPEYLGGTSTPIDVNIVPQTSASTDGVSPQANLSAYAVGVSHNGDGFVKSFVEHGWIIGLISIRSNYTYQQGLNRMWSRRTKFDMYWPTFAHLGEQEILNQEIYAQGVDTTGYETVDEAVEASDDHALFGYQERYAEYRYYPSQITGKFRSTYAQSLDFWHLAQKFDSLPQLNGDFIEEDPPVDRIIAVPSEPQFLLDSYFDMKCIRPMPLYSVPGLVDHF